MCSFRLCSIWSLARHMSTTSPIFVCDNHYIFIYICFWTVSSLVRLKISNRTRVDFFFSRFRSMTIISWWFLIVKFEFFTISNLKFILWWLIFDDSESSKCAENNCNTYNRWQNNQWFHVRFFTLKIMRCEREKWTVKTNNSTRKNDKSLSIKLK